MILNLHPGTNSIAMSTAVPASASGLVSEDGGDTSSILGISETDEDKLSPSDTLARFSLGPC